MHFVPWKPAGVFFAPFVRSLLKDILWSVLLCIIVGILFSPVGEIFSRNVYVIAIGTFLVTCVPFCFGRIRQRSEYLLRMQADQLLPAQAIRSLLDILPLLLLAASV